MAQKIVGTYYFGQERVQLVLREDIGGEFYATPGDIDCARIKIGGEHAEWSSLLAVLLHEAMEFALMRVSARYSPSDEEARDHCAYVFVANHVQFGEACARVAEFLSECLEPLRRTWEEFKQELAEERGDA